MPKFPRKYRAGSDQRGPDGGTKVLGSEYVGKSLISHIEYGDHTGFLNPSFSPCYDISFMKNLHQSISNIWSMKFHPTAVL